MTEFTSLGLLTLVLCFCFLRIPVAVGVKKASGVYLEKRQICFFSPANLRESTMMISKTMDNGK